MESAPFQSEKMPQDNEGKDMMQRERTTSGQGVEQGACAFHVISVSSST